MRDRLFIAEEEYGSWRIRPTEREEALKAFPDSREGREARAALEKTLDADQIGPQSNASPLLEIFEQRLVQNYATHQQQNSDAIEPARQA